MKALDEYEEGLRTLEEAVEIELEDCRFDDNWLIDALRSRLNNNEHRQAWVQIKHIMAKRSMNKVLRRR